jgi:hypothetical protein
VKYEEKICINSFVSASKMLRRRIPQSGNLMTTKKVWLQTIPANVSKPFMIYKVI